MSPELPLRELNGEESATHERYRKQKGRLSELLSRLQKNEVGRALVLDRISLVGYILPLDREDITHLVIFRDGYMAITQSNVLNESDARFYKERFRRNVNDYKIGQERPEDILKNILEGGRIVARNDTREDAPTFKEAAEKALVMARRNLWERRRVLIKTTDPVLDILSSMLDKDILT